jgi:hypothetical protein
VSRTESRPGTLLGPEGTGASAPPSVRTDVPPNGPAQAAPRSSAPDPVRCAGARGDFGRRDRPYLENCIVDASICSCQVNKGTRRMPWHQEPKKDVGACDKPRGVGNQTLIRGCPNGETRQA